MNSQSKPVPLRVCSFESRRATEMHALLERQGAAATVAPSMREAPLEGNAAAFELLDELEAGRVTAVVFMTGVGAQTLLSSIETRYPRERLFSALAKATVVVRGPKPTAVLHEWGVRIDHRVPTPNTWRELLGVLETHVELPGSRIAVQEYGLPSSELYAALEERGARVLRAPIYRWALPLDVGPLERAIADTIEARFDVLLFTSAQQIRHVLEVAADRREQWLAAARRCVVGSIGPTASEALEEAGLPPDVEASPPKMGVLARETLAAAPKILASR